ncbi:MAG: AsmA family protein [Pseudomonadota bacterium]|nr:MAG: AsmA family protein [Pseudomonadota bacterium]
MHKAVKWIGIVAAALVTVLIILVVLLPLLIDPNQYKTQIEREVEQRTGRALSIPGDIELSVFPWLGVELGELALGNAPGFGEEPFARLTAAEVRVKLLPLLSREVEVDKIVLRGAQIRLQRAGDGRTNWDDLTQPREAPPPAVEPAPTPAPTPERTPAIAALAVGGLEIVDAGVYWDDRQSGQQLRLAPMNLSVSEIVANQPFDVAASVHFESSAPAASGDLELSTQVNLDLEQGVYTLTELRLEPTVATDLLPSGKLAAALGVQQLVYNGATEVASVRGTTLSALGLSVTTELEAKQLASNPVVSGTLEVAPFNPRELFDTLAIEAPATADAKALSRAQLKTKLTASPTTMNLAGLALRLDDTQVAGKVGISNFTKPAYRFDLQVDTLDADRYLPPESTPSASESAPSAPPASTGGTPAAGAPPTPGAAAASAAGSADLEPLRALDAAGTLHIAALKIMNLRAADLRATLNAKNGTIRLHPLTGKLYDGAYTGDIRVDATGKTLRMSGNETLNGVQIGPLLKDYMGEDRLSGKANVSAQFKASGTDPDAVKRTLDGVVKVKFIDGALKGVNVGHEVRRAKALLKGEPKPKDPAYLATDFSSFSATLPVRNGVATNDDLDIKIPIARVSGVGSVNLITNAIDYNAYVKISPAAVGQTGREYEQVKAPPIPIHIGGTLLDPKYDVDRDGFLKNLVKWRGDVEKAKLKSKLTAEEDKAKEKLKQETEEEKDKLEKKLKDKLKKLF